jgi:glutamine cyclotransferase
LKKVILLLTFIASCAHANDRETCRTRCDNDFPGEGWRWAVFVPILPTAEWSVCMDVCKQGKTFQKAE